MSSSEEEEEVLGVSMLVLSKAPQEAEQGLIRMLVQTLLSLSITSYIIGGPCTLQL